MSDDETKAPRFPRPRDRDPYREPAPKTFTPASHAHVTATRAEEPTPPNRLSRRELEDAGFLTSAERAARDARLAAARADARRTMLLAALGVVAFEAVGVLLAMRVPSGWMQTTLLTIIVVVGLLLGGVLAHRGRPEGD